MLISAGRCGRLVAPLDFDEIVHRQCAKGQLHQWAANVKVAKINRKIPDGLK